MQSIKYTLSAIKRDLTNVHAQTFTTAEAALKARDYLRSKGYVATIKTTMEAR